jgi:hypothetical protein
MAISADKLASMVSAISLHGESGNLITNQEELQMWNQLVGEIADIEKTGDVAYFEDWTG